MRARKLQGGSAAGSSAATSRPPDRTALSSDSGSAPTGPPRLTVGGNKPSWREKEAARREADLAGQKQGSASPIPPSDASPADTEPPKRTGYVPPALRDGASSGTTEKWRVREREARGRDESPASNAPSGRYQVGRGFNRDRDTDSQASSTGPSKSVLRGDRRERDRDESTSSLPPAAEPTDGKYRPGAFKSRRTQGQ